MRFADRLEAGRLLAERLVPLAASHPIVLALPRGGVPVAFQIATALGAPLEAFVVRKIGAPIQPELGLGAIAEGGIVVLDERLCAEVGVDASELDAAMCRELDEIARRVRVYRRGRSLPSLEGRTVILVDDGIATGGTARAALRALRERHPGRLVLAVPVAAFESVQTLAAECDQLVALSVPEHLYAIGLHYRDFAQVSDDEVIAWLDRAQREEERPAAPLS
jgi:putative phosphoribosyl transferase